MISLVKNKKSPFEDKAEEIRNAIEPGMANDNVSTVICRFAKMKRPFSKVWIVALIIAVLIGLAAIIFRNHISAFWGELTDVFYSK